MHPGCKRRVIPSLNVHLPTMDSVAASGHIGGLRVAFWNCRMGLERKRDALRG